MLSMLSVVDSPLIKLKSTYKKWIDGKFQQDPGGN